MENGMIREFAQQRTKHELKKLSSDFFYNFAERTEYIDETFVGVTEIPSAKKGRMITREECVGELESMLQDMRILDEAHERRFGTHMIDYLCAEKKFSEYKKQLNLNTTLSRE